MKIARTLAAGAFLAAVMSGVVGLASNAEAAAPAAGLTVTKAELRGTQLRLEGRTLPGSSFIAVESTTSAVGARPDASGVFKAQSDAFTAPDCRVTVRDFRNPTQTVTLTGCTPTITPVPVTPAPPSGRCVITAQPTPTNLTLGSPSVFNFFAAGCSPTTPLSYTVVAGVIPTGMSVGGFQTSSSGNIIGTPSIRGTYRFTIQVTDDTGATDQENFTINVV